MSHTHALNVFTPDFKINAVTREVIQVQPDVLITLMQYDHNSESLRFECPRYIDGHDMSLCNKVEVHFVNSDVAASVSKGGYYTVTDIAVNSSDPSLVNFSWVVSRNSTENVGTLVFSVRFICTTGDVIDYVWHTLPFTYVSVDQGLVSELDPEYQKVYLDNLETEAGKVVVEAAEAKTTALEAAERASEAINDLYSMDVTDKAPAIVCEASGEVISITDSANMPLKGLRLFGKSTQDGTPTPDTPVKIESVEKPVVSVNDQTLNIPHILHGIPVTSDGNYTDSDGQQWICDEVDLERGVYVQRVKYVVFDGSEDELWKRDYTSDASKRRMVTTILTDTIKKTANNRIANIICNRFVKARADDTYSLVERISVDDLGRVHIYHNAYNDAVETWTEFLASNHLEIVCELAETVETNLTETEIAAYKALHTNKPNTVILNDSGAWQSVEYVADTKLYIDNKFAELANK